MNALSEFKRSTCLNANYFHVTASSHNTSATESVSVQRDALGRIAGETQSLYSNINSSNGPPGKLEFEHTIAYRYDVLGALVSTELPAAMSAGRIDYQRYGSGHLHGIALDGNSLIDFERDHLHRESQRTLYGVNTANTKTGNTAQLRISRDLDVMGRLLTQQLEALNPAIPAPQLQRSAFDAPSPPEPRVGGTGNPSAGSIGSIEPEALTRHYRYNALGQLTEVRVAGLPQLAKQLGRTQLGPHSPTLQQASTLHAAQRVLSGSVLQFDYDPLGRLIAATDPLDPEGALNRYRSEERRVGKEC